jgi:dipeptide transport system ATP-binding protein
MKPALLEVRDLRMQFDVRRYFRSVGAVHALGGVSFKIEAGETVAIVGESGCGKSTLARCLLGIEQPTGGDFLVDGKSPEEMDPAERRRAIQMIFQDPYGSLNPRRRSWQIIAEPLAINTRIKEDERRTRAIEMMRKVGLRPELADRYPHMLSGGQRQRLGIARALVLQPRLLVCDEPVSALDVSIQAQILNLLMDLQEELGLAYLFISHDLSVVRHIAD